MSLTLHVSMTAVKEDLSGAQHMCVYKFPGCYASNAAYMQGLPETH